jgi:hypothetical protein
MTEGPAAEGRAAWDRAQEQLSKELHARVLRKIEADGMAARQTRIFMQGIGKLQPTTEERRYIGCAYLVTKERADAEGTAHFYGDMSFRGIKVVVMAEPDSEVATIIEKGLLVQSVKRGLAAVAPYDSLKAQSN